MPFEKTKQHPTMDSTFLCLKVFSTDSRLWTAVRVNFAECSKHPAANKRSLVLYK